MKQNSNKKSIRIIHKPFRYLYIFPYYFNVSLWYFGFVPVFPHLYLYMLNGRTTSGTLAAGVCATFWLVTYVWTAVLKLFTVLAQMWVSDKQFQSLAVFTK